MATIRSILPVPYGTLRPLWSVMIPTYNCAGFLRETLSAVLAQDPGPTVMQIEVVDDHSDRDDPESVVHELGNGRVAFYRQPVNVGHASNFNTCIERAKGELVHILHGDDCVRDGFYEAMQQIFSGWPEVAAAFCRVELINERGRSYFLKEQVQSERGPISDAPTVLATLFPVQTPAIVVKRGVYQHLGGFDERFRYCGEDLEMWMRIAGHYQMGYEPQPLALYRTHQQSLSGESKRTGQNIRDSLMAIETYDAYLPAETSASTLRLGRKKFAFWALDLARQMIRRNDIQGGRIQMREALRCSMAMPVLFEAGKIVWLAGRQILMRRVRRGRNVEGGKPVSNDELTATARAPRREG
jgi:hypothetical protein